MRRRSALWPLASCLVLALAACGSAGGRPNYGIDRIAFIGPDGRLYTARGDGSNVVSMTGDSLGDLTSGNRRVESWPTWSPDGRWIAFGRLNVSGGTLSGAAVAAVTSDGQGERLLPLGSGTVPIYLSWSPDSRWLTALVQQRDSLALRIADFSQDQPSLQPAVDSGAPLFTSWSPDSRTLLLHVNGDRRIDSRARLARLQVGAGAGPELLPMAPGAFSTPAWAPDAQAWAFAAGVDEAGRRLHPAGRPQRAAGARLRPSVQLGAARPHAGLQPPRRRAGRLLHRPVGQ